MLQDNCQRHGQLPAVIDGEHRLDYRQLYAAVQQCAGAMASHGVRAGDRICIWAPNSWRWIVCAFACWQRGAVVVPISSRLKALEAGPVLQRSAARLLFSVGDCAGFDLPHLLAAHYGEGKDRPIEAIASLEKIIVFDEISSLDACSGFEAFMAGAAQTENGSTATGDTLGEVLFTSGTTGVPKGVMLNQQQVLQAFWDWSDIGGLQAGDRFLVIPPFSHGFGINAGILACVMRGMTHIVVDFFNPDTALQLINEHQVSVMSGPPALFASLAETVSTRAEYAASANSLRVAYVGAAHVPKATITSMQRVLGIDRVINAYGLIEACVVSMTRHDDSTDTISTTVGRPLPDVEIKLVDEQNRDVPESQPGEILVRGYGVMQGYFDAPEASAACITGDGWLHTGDVGTLDSSGNLSIVGRKKDMYICNGFNVYPAEVEDLLLQHPRIAQAAVVGVDHAAKGETGVAFIVGTAGDAAGNTLAEDALTGWAREHMASYKVPQRIFQLDSFPLNANGKVRKEALKALALEKLQNAGEVQEPVPGHRNEAHSTKYRAQRLEK